jgi:hypothetical protein
LLLHGQGLLDVKVKHGLKDDRAVLSKERIELGMIQSSNGIIAKENAFLRNHMVYVPSD